MSESSPSRDVTLFQSFISIQFGQWRESDTKTKPQSGRNPFGTPASPAPRTALPRTLASGSPPPSGDRWAGGGGAHLHGVGEAGAAVEHLPGLPEGPLPDHPQQLEVAAGRGARGGRGGRGGQSATVEVRWPRKSEHPPPNNHGKPSAAFSSGRIQTSSHPPPGSEPHRSQRADNPTPLPPHSSRIRANNLSNRSVLLRLPVCRPHSSSFG